MSECAPWEEDPPNLGRVFDLTLGGTEHRQVDREFAAEITEILPSFAELCRGHRRFANAVVDHWCAVGVEQFLELGSGLPTMDHVHQRARRHDRGARVVYVENDEVALARARRLVDGVDGVAVVAGDLTDPAAVLADPGLRAVLDLDRPVGVLACAVLHYVPDAVAAATVAGYRDGTVPGSGLAISCLTDDGHPALHDWSTTSHEGWSFPPVLRGPADMTPWLEGFSPVGPGWVSAPHWAPTGPVPTPAETGSGLWGVCASRM